MAHPFYWLHPPARWIVLTLLVVGTIGFAVKLTAQGKPLSGSVPRAVLAYEFAWTRAQAETIVSAWRGDGLIETARRQLQLDFGFLVLYPLTLALLVSMLTESPHDTMSHFGLFLAWAVLASGPLDAVENVALLKMLDGEATDALTRLAAWCAGLKFTLVFSAMGYLLLQGLAVAGKKLFG